MDITSTLTDIGESYLENYNLQNLPIDEKKYNIIIEKFNDLSDKARKLGYFIPDYEMIFTKSNLDGFGFSARYSYEGDDLHYAYNINVFQFELELITHCFEVYLNDTMVHEFAHMIHDFNFDIDFKKTYKTHEEEVEGTHPKEWLDLFILFGGQEDIYFYNNFYNDILIDVGVLTIFTCKCKTNNKIDLGPEETNLFLETGQTYVCDKCNSPFLIKDLEIEE